MKVLLFGYGLIGKERYDALINLKLSSSKDIHVLDTNYGAKILSTPDFKNKEYSLKNVNFIDKKSIDTKYDLVIISTPHIDAKKIFFEYKNLSDTVLIEKPMGLTLKDAEEMHKISNDFRKIFVGFNYRFFPPIQKLRHDLLNNEFGDLISVSITLGLGHQPGADKSWRLDKKQIPFGSLIDPGVHVLDLINYLFGGISSIKAISSGNFWKKNMYEDISILGKVHTDVNLSARISNVMWRSTFELEVVGESGYGLIEGRGRSYGTQIYKTGKKWGWTEDKSQRDSEIIIAESNCEDSFKDEIKDIFITNKNIAATSEDGYNAMKLIDEIDDILKLQKI